MKLSEKSLKEIVGCGMYYLPHKEYKQALRLKIKMNIPRITNVFVIQNFFVANENKG